MLLREDTLGYLASTPFVAIPIRYRDTSSLDFLLPRKDKHAIHVVRPATCERAKGFCVPDHLVVKSRTCL